MKTRNLITHLSLTVLCTAVLSFGFAQSTTAAEPEQMVPMQPVNDNGGATLENRTNTNTTPRGTVAQPMQSTGTANSTNAQPLNTTSNPPLASGQPTATSQPAADGEPQYFVVERLNGIAKVAPVGVDVFEEDKWKELKQGDKLGAGVQLYVTGQSQVKLVLEPASPPTVMLIEAFTQLSIEDLAIREGTSTTRIALASGAIRAGVIESTTRSDFLIEAPTATLSKKGTDIFRFEYQNGRFHMSLSSQGRGLVQAIKYKFNNSGDIVDAKSRFVTRGQFVTQQMMRAIDNVKYDRDIQVSDFVGLTTEEQLNLLFNNGLAILLPFADNSANFLGSPYLTGGVNINGGQRPTLPPIDGGPIASPDGDFGVGQGLLPGLPTGFFNAAAKRSRMIQNLFGQQHRELSGRKGFGGIQRNSPHRNQVRRPGIMRKAAKKRSVRRFNKASRRR